MFDKFGLVMVVVSDMARSVAFYRDVLGLKLLHESPYFSRFDVGGVGLGLHPESQTLRVNAHGGVSFGFYTDDIEGTLAALTARGAQVVTKTREEFGILAKIGDPDGYRIQICQMSGGGSPQ